MASFQFTEHSIMRFKQRHHLFRNKDNFEIYLLLKKQRDKASLTYVKPDGSAYYYELPDYNDYYFLVDAHTNICVTIVKLEYKQKIGLDYPNF